MNAAGYFQINVRIGKVYRFFQFYSAGKEQITVFNQVVNLKNYFNLFFAKANQDGSLKEGWLKQIHRSAGGGDKFLFNASLFSPDTFKNLMKVDWNKEIYRNEGVGKDNFYKTGLFGSKFDSFKKKFIEVRDSAKSWQNITNQGEQLYRLTFETLAKLYNFI